MSDIKETLKTNDLTQICHIIQDNPDKVHVKISWYGSRRITVDDYKGSASINDIWAAVANKSKLQNPEILKKSINMANDLDQTATDKLNQTKMAKYLHFIPHFLGRLLFNREKIKGQLNELALPKNAEPPSNIGNPSPSDSQKVGKEKKQPILKSEEMSKAINSAADLLQAKEEWACLRLLEETLEKGEESIPLLLNFSEEVLAKEDKYILGLLAEKIIEAYPAKIPQVVSLAQNLLKKDDSFAARIVIEKVLEKDKNNINALLTTVDIDLFDGFFETDEMEQAIDIDPTNIEVRKKKAYSLARGKFWNEGIETINEAMKIAPNDYTLNVTKAKIYDLQGKHDLAIKELNDALKIHPNHPEILILLSRITRKVAEELPSERENLLLEAFNYISKVQENDPYYIRACAERSDVYQAQGKNVLSLAALNEGLQINPDDVFLLRRRAEHHFNLIPKSGSAEQSLKDYQEIFKIQSSQGIPLDKALRLKDIEHFIELEPNNAHLLQVRAKIYAQSKEHFKKALKDLNKAIELEPNNIKLRLQRVQWYEAQMTEKYNPREDLERILEMEPKNIEALYKYGQLLSNAGDKNADQILGRFYDLQSTKDESVAIKWYQAIAEREKLHQWYQKWHAFSPQEWDDYEN